MASSNTSDRVRSPSGTQRHNFLPTTIQHMRTTQDNKKTITSPATMSTLRDLAELPRLLDDSSIHIGISPPDNKTSEMVKEVRFNSRITVVEVPSPELSKANRVSFSDEVINIDAVNTVDLSPAPSGPPDKHVRFGCLKIRKRRNSAGTPIYKMKSFSDICPLLKPKKRVRFGCMKTHSPPSLTREFSQHPDPVADEAETFKKTCLKRKEEEFTEIDEDEIEVSATLLGECKVANTEKKDVI